MGLDAFLCGRCNPVQRFSLSTMRGMVFLQLVVVCPPMRSLQTWPLRHKRTSHWAVLSATCLIYGETGKVAGGRLREQWIGSCNIADSSLLGSGHGLWNPSKAHV